MKNSDSSVIGPRVVLTAEVQSMTGLSHPRLNLGAAER